MQLPVSSHTLCLYVIHLARTFSSISAIRNYIAGIRTMHIKFDLDTSAFDSIKLKWVIRGVQRQLTHCPRQVLPITINILHDLVTVLGSKGQWQVVMRTLFIIAFFLMCRKSNLVPDRTHLFDQNKQLTRGDIRTGKSMLLVTIKWSKTIQFGERVHVIPIMATTDSKICPVRNYARMCKLLKGSNSDPAFFVINKHRKIPITYQHWRTWLKRTLAHTGRDHTKFASHSFRRGGASFAFQAGVPTELIKLMGDWRSDVFFEYLQIPMVKKAQAAQQFSAGISKK